MSDSKLRELLSQMRDVSREANGDLPELLFQYALDIVSTINVDLLVRDETRRILLSWREDEFGSGWHIPGGVIRRYETFAERISAVANEELAVTVSHEEQPCYVLDNGRLYDRGHFISLLFRCTPASEFRRPSLFGDRERPRHTELAWFDGPPDNLYYTQKSYPDWIWAK